MQNAPYPVGVRVKLRVEFTGKRLVRNSRMPTISSYRRTKIPSEGRNKINRQRNRRDHRPRVTGS